MKNNKVFVIAGVSVVAILVFGSLFNVPQAQANRLSDLWDNFLRSFSPRPAAPAPVPQPTNNVPLYKPVIDYEQAVVGAVKKASPAVVSITISKNVPIIENCPMDPFGSLPPEFRQFFGNDFGGGFTQPCDSGKTKLQEVGGGSGFIVSPDGLILTNKHVAGDKKASYTVFTNDGKRYDAKILALDPVQDLAVIKINASNLPTVTLGDSGSLALGQTAIAIGNALGEFKNTVSVGVISGLARTVTASGPEVGAETIQGVIQTDAAINPGNSGGPLLNLKGEVVGINTAIAAGAQNIGFAIPINRAKKDISSVKATGEIVAPFLGVRYLAVTAEIAKEQKLPVDYGALVRGSDQGAAVTKNSPADKAGVLAEDIILEVNGQKVDSDHPLGDEIAKYNVGDTVTLKINRGGKEINLTVVLAKRPA
ncbi:MAG: trypsin-like peptidase domain-containing protein [Candidatus Liptonbacteria bacterium]|nr:trypsin-like peptidase domain-containing protein [Candidatus Liptonbacteria bacterium]